ncbi:HutD family protein [Ancylobacter sp. A5.8]|uniref:HutD/Ves family protein n=1 Tax=Ancylobacter gelatini TaxID=2919920 RepID=UPI001F4D36DB|nr:HutD family protein [Ancylobacter gelatini]MCJ8141393.1 HutD family protein [Ancylobacter gelatini]
MRVLRASGHRVMPWKNGGGSTTQIAVAPEGAGLEAFDWRVSMADVAGDGPFSSFPGIDRTLAILSGAGMRLDIAGRASLELKAASAPAAFPADVPTAATLIDGPIRDLNVMTRRGGFAHKVTRHEARAVVSAPAGGFTLVLSRMAGLVVAEAAGAAVELGLDDAVRLDGPATLTPGGDGAFFVIELWPVIASARL